MKQTPTALQADKTHSRKQAVVSASKMSPSKKRVVPGKKTTSTRVVATAPSLAEAKVSSMDKPQSEKSKLLTINRQLERRLRLYGSLGIGLFFGGLYILTMPRTIVGYGDSDMLLTVANNLGVAHPPGYPLYVLLLFLATRLPLPLSVAGKGHLLSALLAVAALVFVFNAVWELWKRPKQRDFVIRSPEWDRLFVSTWATSILGLSTLYWLYGHIAEKYALLSFFAGWLIFLLIRTYKSSSLTLRNWVMLWVLFGFSLVAHYTAIYLLPALLWVGYSKRVHNEVALGIKGIVAGVLSFLLPFGLLLVFASRQPAISWEMKAGMEGILQMIGREDFGGQVYGQSGQEVFGLLTKIDLNQSTTGVIEYLKLTFRYFGWWLLPVLLLGLRFGHKRRGGLFVLVLLLVVSTTVGLAATFLKWPADLGSQAILQRQYLLGYVSLPLLAFFGLTEVVRRLGKATQIVSNNTLALVVVIGLSLLTLLAEGYRAYPQANLASYRLIHDIYATALTNVEEKAVVTCYSDISCFALLYLQEVETMRPDVTVVPLAYPLVTKRLESERLRQLAYTDNPYLMLDVVTSNIDKRPVYAFDLNSYYHNFLGLQNGFLYYVPNAQFGRITKAVPEQLPASETHYYQQARQVPVPADDLMKRWQLLNVAQQYILNGITYFQMGLRSRAVDQLNQAANIHYNFGQAEKEQINAVRNSIEQAQATANYTPGSVAYPAQYYLDYIPDLLAKNRNSQALLAAKAATTVEPDNVEARLLLASMYEKMGDQEFATYEYRNALIFDPENASASSRLTVLSMPEE